MKSQRAAFAVLAFVLALMMVSPVFARDNARDFPLESKLLSREKPVPVERIPNHYVWMLITPIRVPFVGELPFADDDIDLRLLSPKVPIGDPDPRIAREHPDTRNPWARKTIKHREMK